ncbi:hypothetical protein [Paenibacillus sanguinis]|uniref:hypothetical protein n=1 Tax=Paenibacillus sanguinis TaxID=225906 RepID=UPI001969DF7E|nr:hypothetical protein [Paenibacillus sanguinis]
MLSHQQSILTSGRLLGYIQSNTIKTVFVSPDITLTAFSSNLLRTVNEWVIEIVDQITNVIVMGSGRPLHHDHCLLLADKKRSLKI